MAKNRIDTKKDLCAFIKADRARLPIAHPFLSAITYSESWAVREYLTILRYYEYHLNSFRHLKEVLHERSLRVIFSFSFHAVFMAYYFMRWRRKSLKTGLQIFPNTCGPGLAVTHQAYVHIDNLTTMGEHCSILPMVLFGKNKPGKIEVGNNVTFGCGVTVLAPCKIGNNVYIGAGAVVNRDIPDNCVVAGVPAKVIRKINV